MVMQETETSITATKIWHGGRRGSRWPKAKEHHDLDGVRDQEMGPAHVSEIPDVGWRGADADTQKRRATVPGGRYLGGGRGGS